MLHSSPAASLVQVALPVPIDTLFPYTVPAAIVATVQPGCRVLVPFGARRMTGLGVTCGARLRDGSGRHHLG